jgi:phosphate transport system substrate-binding protein
VIRGRKMKKTSLIIAAILILVIVIGSVFAYPQLATPSSTPTPAPSNTQTPTTSNSPAATPAPATINGAGATFPQPFLNASIVYYTSNVRTNVLINYPGGGSGAGVSALTQKTVDFACSDAALTASQTSALSSQVVTIPETIGAITIAYNLPGVPAGLNLTSTVLADIYLGTITKWNDQAIQNINTGITMPNQAIAVFHRSENSGTTKWFTQYLSTVSPTWNTTISYGQSVAWPENTRGSSGNSGVATSVNTTLYSIGYVELAYALNNHMTVAAIQNPSGNYVLPSLASTTAAAESLPTSGLPSGTDSWTAVNILNTSGANAYPICSPTYTLVYKDLSVVPNMDLNKATQLVQFLWFLVHGAQDIAPNLQYASLPSNIVSLDETTIRSITFNGQAIQVG